MDPAILTAATGLIGTLVGAASSMTTTWLGQRDQRKAQMRAQEVAKREALYAEFITVVSKHLIDALGRQPEGLEVVVSLEAYLGKMRLMSSREVIKAAEKLVRLVVETYASPNLTVEQVLQLVRGGVADPLEEFGEACRTELGALRG